VTSSAEAARPAWISESDAETTWMSRNAMNMPKHMATKATTRAGSTRSLAAAAAAPPASAAVAAVMVAAFAIRRFSLSRSS
jgi:hypothetical protein